MDPLQQHSFTMARKAIPGWIPVALSEKQRDASWGEQGRCFLVALRQRAYAHLPFPSVTHTVEGQTIPARALCFLWQGDSNYTCMDSGDLQEFSGNPHHPTVNDCMHALARGMVQMN